MSEEITATQDRVAEPEKQGACGPACVCHRPDEPSFEEQIQLVLDKVRPFIQMDGGDIELIAVEDRNALVRMHGACVGCSSSSYTLKLGVEQAIRRDIPDFGELIQVD
jgi:Fe-S cluster biogenesis protein NfuA